MAYQFTLWIPILIAYFAIFSPFQGDNNQQKIGYLAGDILGLALLPWITWGSTFLALPVTILNFVGYKTDASTFTAPLTFLKYIKVIVVDWTTNLTNYGWTNLS